MWNLASSGLEADEFANMLDLSNHMGLFLQKTNIIRDYLMSIHAGEFPHTTNVIQEYLEDILEEPAPRMFWPSVIWGKYGQQLSDFKEVSNRDGAIQCLNHMITDAMRHLPFSIEHMSKVRDVQVFRFCAIPQIMAIATLAMCYNNGKVFEGVVKMKRGKVSTVFTKCSNMGDLFGWFLRFLHMLAAKLDAPDMAGNDPTLPDMRKAVSSSIQLCQGNLDQCLQWRKDNPSTTVWPLLMDLCALAGSGTYALYALNLGGSHTAQPEIGQMLGIGSSGPLQTAHVLLSVLLLVLLSLRRIFVAR